MKQKRRSIFSIQFLLPNIILLVVVWAGVESTYRFLIRPRVTELMLQRSISRALQDQKSGGEIQSQPLLLVIKDREPETEIIFFLWGTLFLCYRMYLVHREQRMLEHDFVRLSPGERILPEGALERALELRGTIGTNHRLRGRILPGCVLLALQRFYATGSVSEAMSAVRDRAERISDELDSALSLARYVAWAIPAIGFVGTARGIGDALTFADVAVKGDIGPVTSWLGLAFNSTLVGLMLSLPLMYFIHVVQSTQEVAMLDIQSYCCDHIVDAMKLPAPSGADDDEAGQIPGTPSWST
jgi:biopolymer transport protein ExbB/TolQ